MLRHIVLLIGVLATLLSTGSVLGQGFGSAFTYQGYLSSSGGSVNGSCDFQFGLFTSVSGVGQIGSTVTTSNVTVSNGAFSALLDFGSVYDGGPRYLEIAVRCPAGSGSYTTLSPRQLLTPTVYAIHAGHAPWTGLVNVPAGFADGTDADLLAALTCSANQIPKWNGTAWACAADVDTTYTAGTGLSLNGTTFRLLPGCATDEIPKWNGTAWACAADADTDTNTTYTAGTGLNLTGTTFSLLPGCSANQIPKWNGTAWLCAADSTGTSDWALTGNAGTNPASNFIGTTDNQPLEFRVNNTRILRLEPNVTSPNSIGGNSANYVYAGVYGAVIGGGGGASDMNFVTDHFGTVCGGRSNMAGNDAGTTGDAVYATVSGGYNNYAMGISATVSGGYNNYATGSYGIVGGGAANFVTDDYSTISGGGTNRAGDAAGTTADAAYATVGGGENNWATGSHATVSGGYDNRAGSQYAMVGGGRGNQATNFYSTVGGGQLNNASGDQATVSGGGGNIASGDRSAVCGGNGNTASGGYTFMGGGQNNVASGGYTVMGGGFQNDVWGTGSVITGGNLNFVTDDYGTIGGGQSNQAGNNAGATTDTMYATVSGGYQNRATGNETAIGGGTLNIASGSTATVAGGYSNQATGWNASVGGGGNNLASGTGATIPGGTQNEASGVDSFAAGMQARALHHGAFVWADRIGGSFSSTADNQFSVRAGGGVRIYTNSAGLSGVTLASGSGSWASVSDRNVKENVTPVSPQAVLQSVAALPISTWNYIAQGADVQHIGPMAQDFYAAFGTGEDDRHISTIDADGVALAAIQGLYQEVQDKDRRIADLETENAALKSRLDDLDGRLAALEGLAGLSPQAGIPLPAVAVVGLLALGGWFVGRHSKERA